MRVRMLLRKVWRRLLGANPSVEEWRERGVTIGRNCHIYGSIDNGHEFLVTMGDNVTMASGSKIFTHDGSTKKIVGYSRVGRVDIGNDVFVGAGAIILPSVTIGSRVIIGAGCVVARDVPDNSVVVGNPARIIGTFDAYVEKTKKQVQTLPVWETHYAAKTEEEKQQMKQTLQDSGYGFDI